MKRNTGGQEPSNKRQRGGARPSSTPPQGDGLDNDILERMFDFLDARRGACDFDQFQASFPRTSKRELEGHFDFVPIGEGRVEICVRSARGGSAAPAPTEEIGRIISWIPAKGFGFVQTSASAKDVFFPKSALPPNLQDASAERLRDMEVSFELSFQDGKPRAERVDPLPPRGGGPPPEPPRAPSRGGGGGGGGGGGPRPEIAAGTIVRFEEAKGFGFIEPEGGGEDMFFLRSELPPEMQGFSRSQLVDNFMEFEVHQLPDGKMRAKRLVLLDPPGRGGHRGGSSGSRSNTSSRSSIHTGIIISYDTAKGFGFIKPDDMDQDVFYLRSELPPDLAGGAEPRRDEVVENRVEFELKQMPDGKLRAERVVFLRGGGGGGAGGGGGGAGRGGGLISGTIRNFNKTKGYGFIEVPGQPDVFFLPSALPKEVTESSKPLEGLDITFEQFTNEEGKPRARNMHVKPPGRKNLPPPPLVPMGGLPPPPGIPSRQQAKSDSMKVVVGTVHNFDVAKNFGFIKADGFSSDIFFQRLELPTDLRETQSKEQVVGQLVEFELKTMPDGKLRARRIIVLKKGGTAMGPRTRGRIRQYLQDKGYGFIDCDFAEKVFFLRSSLPKAYNDATESELKDLEVSFELYEKEPGKPRANAVEVLSEERRSSDGDFEAPNLPDGEVTTGEIVSFEAAKGYGFVKADSGGEDIFFLRSEMPSDIQGAQSKDEVIRRRVEFEVKVMPDGKMRAQRMMLLDDDRGPQGDDTENKSDIEEDLIQQMTDYLADKGNGCEYGAFTRTFRNVKKKTLQKHFDVMMDQGNKFPQRIELPMGHPQRVDVEDADMKSQEEDEAGVARDDMDLQDDDMVPQQPDEAEEDANAKADDYIDPNEPSIPMDQKGVMALGVVRTYDAAKGWGFIRVEGLDQDVFFPRKALPLTFHGTDVSQMPELVGVQASFDYNPSGRGGPRTDQLNLLLRWVQDDKCWILRRGKIPPKSSK